MTPAERLLVVTTLRAWLEAGEAERAVIIDAVLDFMPPSMTFGEHVGHAKAQLPFVIHQPTQLGFFLVFGDEFIMGRDETNAREAWRSKLDADELLYLREPAFTVEGPPRIVKVAPFFIAEASLSGQWSARFNLNGLGTAEAFNRATRERLAAHGFRLPSEAEVVFATGPAGLSFERGVIRCADDWHATLVGAPDSAAPWGSSATTAIDASDPHLPPRRFFDEKRVRASVIPTLSLFGPS